MKIFLLNFILLFLGGVSVYSQTKVSGHVFDEFNYPIPYANVIFKDAPKGTITDENGKFYIEDSGNYNVIVVSFMSYKTQEVTLNKKVNYKMKIVLEEDVAQLEEVFIASGKQDKKNNPAIDLLRKVWDNRRSNGIKQYKQYKYDTYEKIEFDLNTIDSSLMKSRLFKGMEFVFNQIDTSRVTGKTYLPIFVNESVSTVYGDNKLGVKKDVLRGNKNSGFSSSQTIIDFVDNLYSDYDVYDNYIKIFQKSFTSPISRTGVSTYNYVLADSSYVDNKWCYNVVYYPRRKGELTFKGDFWVADTTYAIKKINMYASKKANINWVKDIYIEQEFDVLNDSILLLKRDYMMTDFSPEKKEKTKGIYGKRTTIYNNYIFDKEKAKSFYNPDVFVNKEKLYSKDDEFWKKNRLEKLSKDELGVYKMLDTLKTVRKFKRLLGLGTILASNYIEFDRLNFDYGPIFSTIGNNAVEGLRLRAGGRTYRGQNDMWRLEGFTAYGFKDDKFKYGLSGKWLLNKRNRFIVSAGNRRDIEQTAASLTASTDILGRSFASSSIASQSGPNDKLTNINMSVLGLEMEPVKNVVVRLNGTYKIMKSASSTFSLDYYDEDSPTGISGEVKQYETALSLSYYPKRQMTGYGVERYKKNRNYANIFAQVTRSDKGAINSNFDYTKLQFSLTKPWLIGGVGRLFTTIEAGKTYGAVPLSLLSVIPGNESFYAIYNTFSNLNYYEFVTDAYTSVHLQHNFNGRIFSRIPLLRKLNIREIISFRAVMGSISSKNKELNASNINYLTPSEKPYYEYGFSIGNLFKFLRLDFNFRGNYLNSPEARPFSFMFYTSFGF